MKQNRIKDLTQMQCPQLFVQFKWALKQAASQSEPVQFKLLKTQQTADIFRYLNQQQVEFSCVEQSELIFIVVEGSCV
ncbi:hypothetical protein ACFOEE_07695 [Pseudoalteromonas fenneropenaei]|uniref:Uncharacterized protein n=1 Tax=Pseudoalteromonas fenneropenaei TaxID=1737459 RepID=A0ABV7CIM4_9GAMM